MKWNACIGMLAAAACIGAYPAHAGSVATPFTVTVQSSPAPQASAFCTRSDVPGAFGASVTVVCRTGKVVDISASTYTSTHGAAYRYLMQVGRGDFVLGTVDADTGPGTITQWRVVDLSDMSYIEMGIAW